MVRRTLALALLSLTLLFCGLDSSAVGQPADPETALHAMVRGHDDGALGAVVQAAAAAFVALTLVLPLVERTGRPATVRRFVIGIVRQPSIGWRAVLAKRGPPAHV